MGLHEPHRRSIPEEERKALLNEALQRRRRELKAEAPNLLRNVATPASAQVLRTLGGERLPWPFQEDRWWRSPRNFEENLVDLARDEFSVLTATSFPGPPMDLKISRKSSDRALLFIMDRYACPHNIIHGSESELVEELLRFLMVVDLAKEPAVNLRLRWVLLNLLAIRFRVRGDLRILDALNYFWENISPGSWHSCEWAPACLGNYDAALAARL